MTTFILHNKMQRAIHLSLSLLILRTTLHQIRWSLDLISLLIITSITMCGFPVRTQNLFFRLSTGGFPGPVSVFPFMKNVFVMLSLFLSPN